MRQSIVKPLSRSLQLIAGIIFACTVDAQSPLTCEATPDRHAFLIPAASSESGLNPTDGIEVFSDDDFVATLPNGWQFNLIKTNHGWAIRIYDQPFTNGRVDLSAITPPLHIPANPRDIAGWHFRNQSNTGPNVGDVNAPQRIRLFQFDGALAGTGGLRESATTGSTNANAGRGILNIVDFKLTDLQPDVKARMTYLKFQACLTWPRLSDADELARAVEHERRARELDARILSFSKEELETFGACGLNLSLYKLEARVTPRLIGFDIDGDDAHDEVAQVARLKDDRRGLALCRAGTWLQLLGFDSEFDDFTQHLISAMESWRIAEPKPGGFGYTDEPEWPETAGDVLLVERIEKGMAIFYWYHGAVHTQKVYGGER